MLKSNQMSDDSACELVESSREANMGAGRPNDEELAKKFLGELAGDGTPRLNSDVRGALGWGIPTYLRIKEQLFAIGRVRKARGRGGAVALAKRKGKSGARSGKTAAPRPRLSRRTRIFVTHGHDDALRGQVVELLEAVDLDPVVLQDQLNGGRTVIEKFEGNAGVGAAVVLLTGDDRGGKAGEEAKPRARQNVLLEAGFFLGKLGRERVVLLHDGKAEIPSDLSGILHVRTSDNWKIGLLRELKGMGVPISGTLDALLE
jgi:predicted nucleotide-binding protein